MRTQTQEHSKSLTRRCHGVGERGVERLALHKQRLADAPDRVRLAGALRGGSVQPRNVLGLFFEACTRDHTHYD